MRALTFILAGLLASATAAGCKDRDVEHEGALENNLEQAGTDIGQGAEAAGQELQHDTREAAQDIEQAAKAAGAEINQEANEMGRELDHAGDHAEAELDEEMAD